jgi:hypothetical protein
MTIDDMTTEYVAAIREDRDPTMRATALARAVRQHLIDLAADDDPGDGMTTRELQCAYRVADALVKTLQGFLIVLLCVSPAAAQGRTVCLKGGCITSTAAPLPHAEAIRVLCRDGRCTPPPVLTDADGPRVFVIKDRPQRPLSYRFPYCSYYRPCLTLRSGRR